MEHDKFKELIQLALTNELTDNELEKLHKHLLECSECQHEYDRLTKFYSKINEKEKTNIDDEFLSEARGQFKDNLNYELSRQSIFQKVKNFSGRNFRIYRTPILAGAFSLLVGLSIGYFVFSPGKFSNHGLANNPAGNARITNVRIIKNDTSNSQIEFSFDATNEVVMKGDLNNPAIQKILAEALVNEKNPGTRIQTANLLANQTSDNAKVNPKVRASLITAMKYDNNPAVRMEALKALVNLPFGNDINEALLYVLQHDRNSGMRVTAINVLASVKSNGSEINQETINVLNQKAKDDENQYVRIRAASLLKEDNIQ